MFPMNSFLSNQLEDVKNDLKELDVITIRSLENEQDYQDGECSETFRDSEFDGYLKEKRGLNAKIKTKLQKYHEWASEERKEHIKDIGELELLKPIRIAKANIHHKENKIKELSTFISEVEKLAKDNGVELK